MAAKQDRYNLTTGGILQKLLALSLPIMGTQLLQMAYNLTDMFWLGRLGSVAVAASGTVGMFLWLGQGVQWFGNKGAEIGVAQSLGAGNAPAARRYTQNALFLSLCLGLAFSAGLVALRTPLVGFFRIKEAAVVQGAELYLLYVAPGIPFTYLTGAAVGAFNGSGNSRTPFFINATGLVLNMVLDPLLIFTARLGIAGAAIATSVSQAVVCLLMLAALKRYRHTAFLSFRLWAKPAAAVQKQIVKWAAPIAAESILFCFLSMIFSRLIAAFGADAMAAHRIGTQVESLSWLIAGGFSSAFTAYVGQNYGAGLYSRIRRGFSLATACMSVWGVMVCLTLFFAGGPIFDVFLPGEAAVRAIGIQFLRILSVSQFFACLEPVASGAWRGLGKTVPPSLISICVNVCRVCAAIPAARLFGLPGIFACVSAGCFLRGALMFFLYLSSMRRLPRHDSPPVPSA